MKTTNTLTQTVHELTECNLNFNAAKIEFEGRETYNRQAGELLKIAKLIELKESARNLNESIRLSEKILIETEEGIATIRFKQDGLNENIRKWKVQYPDMSLLSEVREWYAIKKQLESAKIETDAEINLIRGGDKRYL